MILDRNNVQTIGGGNQTLIYAHGFGCNQRMWDAITPAFRETHKQILFDYVGSGQSDLSAWNKERYSKLDGYAEDLIEVCDALEVGENLVVVGHSVSATIAMLASIRRPNLFKHLILIGPSPCFINHSPDYMGGFEKADLEELIELMDNNYLGWASYLAPIVSGGSNEDPTTNRLEDSFCSTDPVAGKAFAEATFFADNRADLPKVQTPSLILQNSNDNLVPVEIGRYIHENLQESKLEILDARGHCSHMSHPSLVIDAMKRYLTHEPV